MLTKLDFERLREIFVTKEELNGLRVELKNDILNFKDEILHEIVAMREEFSVITGYSHCLENHEERIEKLEKVVLH